MIRTMSAMEIEAAPLLCAGLIGHRALVMAGEAIPSFPYADLRGQRSIRSVANLTRRDGAGFFDVAGRAGGRTATRTFPLAQANEALDLMRQGKIEGAAVLVPR